MSTLIKIKKTAINLKSATYQTQRITIEMYFRIVNSLLKPDTGEF